MRGLPLTPALSPKGRGRHKPSPPRRRGLGEEGGERTARAMMGDAA